MKTVYLNEICSPKQWKTISSASLLEEGFPVYGANGIIGFYSSYTHEEPTILITCRGATCGTINVSKPKSYVNGNAMALDKLSSKVNLKYLKYILLARGLGDVISGSAQPQITRTNLNRVKIPLPPLNTQIYIASILDDAAALRDKTAQLLKEYDLLAQSIFLDMFGDPVTNPKGWNKSKTIDFCNCIVPGRDKPKSFSGNIPWVTTNDLNHLEVIDASKAMIGLTQDEIKEVKAKIIPINSVIITCVGDLGVISINETEMVVNQQLHAFQCSEKINNVFLMYNLSFQKPYMYKMASNTTIPYMNKTIVNGIPTIIPPIHLQNQFAEKIALIEQQKELAKQELKESEDLFNCLLQKVFKGELIQKEEVNA